MIEIEFLTSHHYQPQRSCGQGNGFTGVCLSTGGRVSASVHAGIPDPPGTRQADPPGTRQADTPRDQAGRPPWDKADPPGPDRHPPDQADTPPDQTDCSIRSTSSRYASYWNAFLL